MKNIFPWQSEQWRRLLLAKNNNRMAHALLFQGAQGIGKKHFAHMWSRFMLCTTPEALQAACGKCHSCRLTEGKVHPNLLWIEPEEDAQSIKVDQIRLVSDFINQSALQQGYRIVIISPANKMNVNAANALLKTLEEPANESLIILLAEQNGQLPATILSRTQCVWFAPPDKKLALQWLEQQTIQQPKDIDLQLALKISHGAPLAALDLIKNKLHLLRDQLYQILISLAQRKLDPLKAYEKLSASEFIVIIDFMLSWIIDLLRLQLGGPQAMITNDDYAQQLTTLKVTSEIVHNQEILSDLQRIRTALCLGLNMNKQLMLECLLIRWMEQVHYVSR